MADCGWYSSNIRQCMLPKASQGNHVYSHVILRVEQEISRRHGIEILMIISCFEFLTFTWILDRSCFVSIQALQPYKLSQ
jgi:hypothetical protein